MKAILDDFYKERIDTSCEDAADAPAKGSTTRGAALRILSDTPHCPMSVRYSGEFESAG
jgi:hypothetical protein